MINIEELKPQIIKALMSLNPDKIILFGSYAYGEPNEDSDLDICIIKRDYKNKWEEKAKIRKSLNNLHMPIDILNPKTDEYNFYKKEYGSVYKDIEEKGVLLWQNS